MQPSLPTYMNIMALSWLLKFLVFFNDRNINVSLHELPDLGACCFGESSGVLATDSGTINIYV